MTTQNRLMQQPKTLWENLMDHGKTALLLAGRPLLYCLHSYCIPNMTKSALRWLFLVSAFLVASLTQAQAPQFTTPTPEDIVVNCIDDIPVSMPRMATDNNDPSFPKSVAPLPDSPDPMSLDPCIGGLILRIWTVSDLDGNVTRDTQEITLLPDNTPPLVQLPNRVDTILCDRRNDPGNPFAIWLDTRRLELSLNYQECNIDNITDNAPASFDTLCGSVTVTFTLADQCGQSSRWNVGYTIIDTVPPMLMGVPANLTLGCDGSIPPPPNVTAIDNCTRGTLPVTYEERSGKVTDGTCTEYKYFIRRIILALGSNS